MVSERYCEYLIQQKPTPANMARVIVLVVLTLGCVIAGLTISQWICTPAVLFGVLLWFAIQKIRQEFEYLILDHELSVDAIYGHSRRKKIMNCPLKKVVLFAPENSSEYGTYRHQNLVLHDFSTRNPEDTHYAMVCKNESGTIGFRLTPNAEMLELLDYELPRGILIKENIS